MPTLLMSFAVQGQASLMQGHAFLMQRHVKHLQPLLVGAWGMPFACMSVFDYDIPLPGGDLACMPVFDYDIPLPGGDLAC